MIKPLPSEKSHHVFPLRLPREVLDLLDQFAEKRGIKTRTQAVGELIRPGTQVTSESAGYIPNTV